MIFCQLNLDAFTLGVLSIAHHLEIDEIP